MARKFVAALLLLSVIFIGQETITLAQKEYEIQGASIVACPANEIISTVTYRLSDQDGLDYNADWSLVSGDAIFEKGKLILSSKTQIGDIVIGCSYNGLNFEKKISIRQGLHFNFEGDVLSSKPVGWKDNYAAYIDQDDGNKFLRAYGGYSTAGQGRLDISTDTVGDADGVVSIEFDVRIDSEDKEAYALCLSTTNNWMMQMIIKKNGTNSSIIYAKPSGASSVNTTGKATWPSVEWKHVLVRIDYEKDIYVSYIDGEKDIEYPLSSASGRNIRQLIVSSGIDNLAIYSGEMNDIMVQANIPAIISKPEKGKEKHFALSSTEYAGDIALQFDKTWSLAEDIVGVSLNGNILTLSETAEGIIPLQLQLNDAGISREFSITVIDAECFDFSDLTIVPDYFKNANIEDGILSMDDTSEILLDERLALTDVLISMHIKDDEGFLNCNTFSLSLTNKKVMLPNSINVAVGDEFTLDLMEYNKKTYLLIDDTIKFVFDGDTNFNAINCSLNLKKLAMTTCDIDRPYVYNLNLIGAPVTGGKISVDYTYLCSAGIAEDGTKIEWYADGQVISEDESILLTGFEKGTEIYFSVVPKNGYADGIRVYSDKVIIMDALEAELNGNAITLTINPLLSNGTLYIDINIIALINSKCADIIILPIKMSSETQTVIFSDVSEEHDAYRIFATNPSDSAPLSEVILINK